MCRSHISAYFLIKPENDYVYQEPQVIEVPEQSYWERINEVLNGLVGLD